MSTLSDHRYTAFDAPGLPETIESHLQVVAATVAEELGEHYHALVLGGGYGRGEGGGTEVNGVWKPYNDYDLFVVVTQINRIGLRELRLALVDLGKSLEGQLGLEVELAPMRDRDLSHLPFTMMWCELLGGHKVVDGDENALKRATEMRPENLPLFEGVHYLCNRAALLLWSLVEKLPANRVWKFVHKAWLAIGAAVLIAERRFEIGYGNRLKALEQHFDDSGPKIPHLLQHYRAAARDRVRPEDPPNQERVIEARDQVIDAMLTTWRWFEEQRLGVAIPDFGSYAAMKTIDDVSLTSIPMNILRQYRFLGKAGFSPLSSLAEHPRNRAIRSVPALLARTNSSDTVSRLVGGGRSWSEQSSQCLNVWRNM